MRGLRLMAVLALLAPAGPAPALTITLSDMSSDGTPAGQLDATFDFSFDDSSDVLTLVVTNDTTSPNEFNVNQIFFNGSDAVTGLTLQSAIHSDVGAGDVTAAWEPVESATPVDGFGTFDFGLTNGVGEKEPSVIGPSEFITFSLSASGSASSDFDFVVQNLAGKTAAAKFVNGPDDPESPGSEDSAFGATSQIPEPGTFALFAAGLVALGARRRVS